MNKRILCLLVLCLLALTACSAPAASEPTVAPTEEASPTAAPTAAASPTAAPTAEAVPTDTPAATEAPEDPYADLLATYEQAAQEGWDMDACDAAGLSLMCGRPEQEWGYALVDLDGDGTQEFLVGNGREIFDLYALQDGQPQKLLTGWERNAYVLCEDGTIYNTASGGAAYTVFTDYQVRGGALVPVRTVVFDTDTWTSYDGAEGEGEGTVLTQEEADAWMEGHNVRTLSVTLLHTAQPLGE
ncbi:MAG: hypothetical protein ACOX83_06420 [Candidatus Spyradocola sp.]|jgi:hypothetical protein